jgi:hypothetical protein
VFDSKIFEVSVVVIVSSSILFHGSSSLPLLVVSCGSIVEVVLLSSSFIVSSTIIPSSPHSHWCTISANEKDRLCTNAYAAINETHFHKSVADKIQKIYFL